MSINNVLANSRNTTNMNAVLKNTKVDKMSDEERKELVEELKSQQVKGDELFLSEEYKSTVNNKNDKTQSSGAMSDIMNEAKRKTQAFERLVNSMFGSQENMYKVAKGDFSSFAYTSKDIAAAKASLEEGGEFSVDAVATRIMDMAKALSGGDESKIATLRKAVERGFEAAGVVVGGKNKLPSICHDTYKEVQKRFDEWEKPKATETEE